MDAGTQQREEFMREAIHLSITKMQEGYGGPFGAVIVRHGKIIARGFNQVLSSNDPTAHAEVDAIRKASQVLQTHELKECDLYTSCEPCPMCLGAIYWARLRHVYFGNTKQDAAAIGFDDAIIYGELGKKLPERKIPMVQVLQQEAHKAFELWQRQENQKKY